jgi:transcription antitermination factor NusG
MTNPRWYALTARHQHEKAVAATLSHEGLESFLPLYRSRRLWSDRIKELDLPLFAGYVFCRFPFENRVSVLRTPGVTSIVGFGKGPTPVPDKEIADLQAVVASGLPRMPWPFLKAGQRVHIHRGPLKGVEGIVLQVKDSWRLVVSVFILQRSVAVEIDPAIVSVVAGAPTRAHAGTGAWAASPALGPRAARPPIRS